MTSEESPKRPRALSPGAPSPRSGGVSPPSQEEAKRCREGTSPPKRSRRQLPYCFLSKLQNRSGVSVPDVPPQEAKHAAAKRRRRVSKYIPSSEYIGEIKRRREETVSPELPPRSASGAPEAQPTQEQDEPPSPVLLPPSESPPRSGSGAPEVPPQEDAYRRVECGRQVLTPSNSDDEPPSPALLDPKRPLSPPSQEEAHRKAKRPRVVSGLPGIIREGPIEVFFEFDGVPSQEEIHAAAKRRGSMRRGSSPLRELSPDPSGGRSPEGV